MPPPPARALGPPLPLCLGALGLRGILAWGPWADPAPGSLLTSLPSRCPCLPGGQERSPGPHLLWSLEASASWDGGDGPRGPRPLRGMEPPAAACHVAQHVTALPCCLERSQAKAEAEPAPGGAGLGLSLTAPSQEPGPERGSCWPKATQQIRDPPGEVLVGEMGVAGS